MSLTIRCRKHPRYEGEYPPKASCPPCVAIYEARIKVVISRAEVVVSKKRSKSK